MERIIVMAVRNKLHIGLLICLLMVVFCACRRDSFLITTKNKYQQDVPENVNLSILNKMGEFDTKHLSVVAIKQAPHELDPYLNFGKFESPSGGTNSHITTELYELYALRLSGSKLYSFSLVYPGNLNGLVKEVRKRCDQQHTNLIEWDRSESFNYNDPKVPIEHNASYTIELTTVGALINFSKNERVDAELNPSWDVVVVIASR
jgi:hypothetical protein